MKVALAADHAGYALKERVKSHLAERGYEVDDFGTDSDASTDYPDYGCPAAHAVSDGRADRGILICGSGQGMVMVANRVRGIRAGLAWTLELARLCRQHNDANVLCLAARFTEETIALEIVDVWLGESFEGGRHTPRVAKIMRCGQEG